MLSNGGGLGVPGWSLAFAVPTVWRTRGHHHAILYDRHGRRSSWKLLYRIHDEDAVKKGMAAFEALLCHW